MCTPTYHLACFLFITVLSTLTGCASTTAIHLEQLAQNNRDLARCRMFYTTLTQQINTAQVRDSQTQPIAHFPYLHVDRFLATYKPAPAHSEKFNAWLEYSRQRALHTQAIEYQNLPAHNRAQLQQTTQALFPHQDGVLAQLDHCSTLLSRQELHDSALRQSIYQNAVFPSDYQTWQRIIGLYAVTALPFAAGIRHWHEESTRQLQQAHDSLVFKGRALRYQPSSPAHMMDASEVAALLGKASRNPLGIPQFSPRQRAALFAHFAPVIEVDTSSGNDRPGAPYLTPDAQVHVDNSQVKVYTLLSYSLFAGKVLPQLNYSVWFPARPCDSALDLLCGKLDGIIWRVTIAANGQALHYDSIHNCGCYHTFFPTRQLAKKPQTDALEEWAFTPIAAPPLKAGQRILLTLASGTHYLMSLNTVADSDRIDGQTSHYEFEDYDTLRSLPLTGASGNSGAPPDDSERKSLFGSDGIIAGTQRRERFLFWPMGVPSPGAMRQWGHHATAFVGRRYFDDPCLLETYYTPALSGISLHGGFQPPATSTDYCTNQSPRNL